MTSNRAVLLGRQPRYSFDTDHGERFIQDQVGLEVADLPAAREMAREGFICGNPREFNVRARGEAGDVVLQAKLSFVMDNSAKAQEQGRS